MKLDPSVDYSTLFSLNDPLLRKPLVVETVQEWLTPKKAIKLFTGEWRPPEPVIMRAYAGKEATDIIYSGMMPLLCISQRLFDLFRDNQFTGWDTFPVELHGHQDEPIPGYHGLVITSYVGPQDKSRGPLYNRPPYTDTGPPLVARMGFFFDENMWDGSDIFRAHVAHIIVNKRVRNALKQAKITNVRFKPLLEIEHSVEVYKP